MRVVARGGDGRCFTPAALDRQLWAVTQVTLKLARTQILLRPRRAVDVGTLPEHPPALLAHGGSASLQAAWGIYTGLLQEYKQQQAIALKVRNGGGGQVSARSRACDVRWREPHV